MKPLRRLSLLLVSVFACFVSAPASAQAAKWEFGAAIYAYLPTISGTSTFPATGGGSSVSVDAKTILDSLKMAFMGSLDASNGTWGGYTDLIYVDLGNSKSNTQEFSIGPRGIPAGTSASLDYDMKGWVWTVAGTYRVVAERDFKVDLLAGARVLNLRQEVSWALAGNVGPVALPDRAGTRELDAQNWDAVVGVKGRAAFGEGRWFVPYYLDLGTGESKFTWQAMGGVGYSFGWGDVVAAWRYIDYQMKSGKPVEDVNFSGPAIAAVFRW
ncbi:MAG: hypothetical protein ACXW2G_11190 [Burkholderiaceae bacterium]